MHVQNTLASITYITVNRSVILHTQHIEKTTHRLQLYQQHIQTAQHEFPLHHVHDLSFRPFSGGTGFLYVHTSSGVFSYEAMEDPSLFIRTFRELKGWL